MSENVVEKLREHGMKSMELEHAGLLETSLMLYLRPELVKMDKAKEVADLTYPSYDTYPEDPERIDPSGALSNPTKGSAELGELMVKDIVEDRKSTRLNSSHVAISYAVFCLKKKRH